VAALWRWALAIGGCVLSVAAHAEILEPNEGDGLTNPAAAPLPFGPPISPPIIDPWSLGGPVCIPGAGPLLPPAPVRERPRRIFHPRPVPAVVPDVSPPASVGEPTCVPEPPARTIAMAAGPAVFNVLTAGARPNSSVTLRIDNRTTVTITVNADPTACPTPIPAGGAGEPAAMPGGSPDATAPPTQSGMTGGVFEVPAWAALWAGGRLSRGGGAPLDQEFVDSLGPSGVEPFPWRNRDHRDEDRGDKAHGQHGGGPGGGGPGGGGHGGGGHGGGGPGGGGQGVIWEPSTLLLLGSGVMGLLFMARRRR
jgi:hypothetical protein